jgi:hypothetical protein
MLGWIVQRDCPIEMRATMRFVSATASLNLRSRFGLFVSALKIPFPGNGDFGSKRPVRMRGLLGQKAEHEVLAGPFHRQVGEALCLASTGGGSHDP